MLKKLKIAIPVLFFIMLIYGCQSDKTVDEMLVSDAENVYNSIKNSYVDGESEGKNEKAGEFLNTYLVNSSKYQSHEELLLKMDALINNDRMYTLANGLQKDEQTIEKYKNQLEGSLSDLDKYFKKNKVN
ncbi:hypothetical protein M3603_08410 [Rummeliibacillus stabekisii]|uniref:hypothetical protein n=1 Tax=Rummeliibacillus stabekisii TaxID=241244 RepID=UPI00203B913D|nr:hypothetical protein [Rummeliibacillus stabekisii]MCM3316699.1 hypothetical protein [Rummeliibacillus stabekisii]